MMMAHSVEMQLSSPIPIPGTSTAVRIRDEAPQYNLPRYGTSGTSFAARPTLDQSFFSLGKGNGPKRRDDRSAAITLSSCVGKSFPWWILLCRPHLKREDRFTIPIRWTVRVKSPNSLWTQLQTTSKEWKLRRTAQWGITQTV